MSQYSTLHAVVRMTARRGEFISEFDYTQIFPNLGKTMKKFSKEKIKDMKIFYKQPWRQTGGKYLPYIRNNVHQYIDNIKLYGDFQSYKYWWEYKEDIKKMFVFSDKIVKKAQKQLARASRLLYRKVIRYKTDDISGRINSTEPTFDNSDITFVAVHSRRTDFTWNGIHSEQYNSPKATYFTNAMKYYQKHYKNPLFIVASDDIEWTQRYFQKYYFKMHFLKKQSAMEDLATLVMCKHAVVSVGTFGWFAGFLAGGEVVYFKDQFKPNASWIPNFPSKDVYPPSWVAISN